MFGKKRHPTMSRYQAYFEKGDLAALKRIAKRRAESVATVLREAVREFVEKKTI